MQAVADRALLVSEFLNDMLSMALPQIVLEHQDPTLHLFAKHISSEEFSERSVLSNIPFIATAEDIELSKELVRRYLSIILKDILMKVEDYDMKSVIVDLSQFLW